MAFKRGKYFTAGYQAVSDPATQQALGDLSSAVNALSNDVAPLLVPTGAIILWDLSSTCPVGYSEVTSLRGLFPRGWDGSTLRATGGSATHSHGGATGSPSATTLEIDGTATSYNVASATHTHTINADNNLPPFYTLLFCRKL